MNTLSRSLWVVIGAGNIGRILLERLLPAGVPTDHLADEPVVAQLFLDAARAFKGKIDQLQSSL